MEIVLEPGRVKEYHPVRFPPLFSIYQLHDNHISRIFISMCASHL